MENYEVIEAMMDIYSPDGENIPQRDATRICKAIEILVPVLELLAERTGWKIWQKWALEFAVYVLVKCEVSICK